MERHHSTNGEEVKYKIRIRKDAPLQENGVDCGVFVCQFAERMTRKTGLNFKQADITLARERMAEELLEGKLKHEDSRNQSSQQKAQGEKAKKTKKMEKATGRKPEKA